MIDHLPVRIAVVGAGPAGCYAIGALLETAHLCVEIDLFERLPTPWGLVRGAVAPDHQRKKLIIDRLFDFYLKDSRVRYLGNIDVGVDVALADLRQWYHAVILTVGAGDDSKLGIQGEALPGCFSARTFVGYYNGHPDFSRLDFDLSGRTAVIIGNGNVALDIARMLTLAPDELAETDIPDRALATLRASMIDEVVILGRRGPEHAAYNAAELEELASLDDVDIGVAGVDLANYTNNIAQFDWAQRRKLAILRALADRPARAGRKRIVFRFFATPIALHGDDRLELVEVARTTSSVMLADARPEEQVTDFIDTCVVFRACGYRGVPITGLTFDHRLGVVTNRQGRVGDDERVIPGMYVAGWIKRGCRGIIGSNKFCARETVASLLADLHQRVLPTIPGRDEVLARLGRLVPSVVSLDGWVRIDHAERAAGRRAERPRIKLTDRAALLAAAGAAAREPVSEER